MENEWFSKEDKLVFEDAVNTQIKHHEGINELYSNWNMELFKVVIDINLEHIEQLKTLVDEK